MTTDGVRRGVPPPPSPARGEAAPAIAKPVAPAVVADARLVKDAVASVFAPSTLQKPETLAAKLPPSLQALLAAKPPAAKGAPPDPSRLEAAVGAVERLLQGGAIAETDLPRVQRALRGIDDVLGLAADAALLPPAVKERVDALLLGPMQRLRDAVEATTTAVMRDVGARDRDAVRERLAKPVPRVGHVDVAAGPSSHDPPSYVWLDDLRPGDLALMPRSGGGAPQLALVVAVEDDGVRMQSMAGDALMMKTVPHGAFLAANPFRIGDSFSFDGKSYAVMGALPDGTLKMLPTDPEHPTHAVTTRGGTFAADLARRMRDAHAAAAAAPAPTATTRWVPTEPEAYARVGAPTVGAYLQNAQAASALFAERIAAAAKPLDGAAFRALCEDMHEVACTGPTGTTPYQTAHYRTDDVKPGVVREGFLHASRPHAAKYADLVTRHLGLPPPVDGPVAVRALAGSSAAAPHNFVSGMHFYPDGDLQPYFDGAAKVLAEILRAPPAPYGVANASADVVDKIADYYHALVNARPFDQVNNSLFMSQVNVLLQRAGSRPVAHGFIDHVAQRLPGDSFRAVFRAHVQSKLPSPQAMGLPAF